MRPRAVLDADPGSRHGGVDEAFLVAAATAGLGMVFLLSNEVFTRLGAAGALPPALAACHRRSPAWYSPATQSASSR